jgi:hypothetical protein
MIAEEDREDDIIPPEAVEVKQRKTDKSKKPD